MSCNMAGKNIKKSLPLDHYTCTYSELFYRTDINVCKKSHIICSSHQH